MIVNRRVMIVVLLLGLMATDTHSFRPGLSHLQTSSHFKARAQPSQRRQQLPQQQQQQQQLANAAIRYSTRSKNTLLFAAPDDESVGAAAPADAVEQRWAQEKEAVGNLVADDEWAGLSMELGEIVKKAVVEDLKANARDFLGADTYKLGDISKQVDARVKQGVAQMRGKEEYEVGDLVLSLDEMSKSLTEELTGKPYETGDLSREIDQRVKRAVADYCGKDEYEVGDLSIAVSTNVSQRVEELMGDYEFGDISREIERRRREWIKDFLGADAAEKYQFGDISKKLATLYTGKEEYKFGDVTKKLMGDLFGGKKKGKDE